MRQTIDGGSAGVMAKDHRLRHRAMEQAQRHRRVARMVERALAFHKHPIVRAGELEDQILGFAREKIANHAISRQASARDQNARLAGREKRAIQPARPGLAVEFQRHGHLAGGAIGADGQHGMAAGTMRLERAHALRLRRAAHVPDRHSALGRRRAQFLVLREEDVQAADQVQPGLDRGQQLPAPGLRQSAAHRGDADQQGIRSVGHRLVNILDHRNVLAEIHVERL